MAVRKAFPINPVDPPYTTALSRSILVKVWPLSGGGPSPVQLGLLHNAGEEDNDRNFMRACQSKCELCTCVSISLVPRLSAHTQLSVCGKPGYEAIHMHVTVYSNV